MNRKACVNAIGLAFAGACFLIPAVFAAMEVSPNEKVISAVSGCDSEKLRRFLTSGVDVNAPLGSYYLIEIAAAKCPSNIVRLLIKQNAKVNVFDGHGVTPLYWAAVHGNINNVNLLLNDGAEVDARGEYGRTPLVGAAGYGFINIVQILIDHGAKINGADYGGETALFAAAEWGRFHIAELLLDHGAVVDAPYAGWTPLRVALKYKHEDVARLLLGRGADVNALPPNLRAKLAGRAQNINRLIRQAQRWFSFIDPNANFPQADAAPNQARLPPIGAHSKAAGSKLGSKGGGLLSEKLSHPAAEPPAPPDLGIKRLERQLMLKAENGQDLKRRFQALHYLNLFHDPNLIPFFTRELQAPFSSERLEAAVALNSILNKFKADHPGGDWSDFNAHAGEILTPLILQGEQSRVAVGIYRKDINYLHLMDEKSQKRFVKGFSDPYALLALLGYNNWNEAVDEGHGLHSDAAQLIYERFKETAHGISISGILSNPTLGDLKMARARLLANLNKYDLLKEALASDPGLGDIVIRTIFSNQKTRYLSGNEIYAIGDAAMRGPFAADFSGEILRQIKESKNVTSDDALLFLKFHEGSLPPPQKNLLDKLWDAKASKKIKALAKARETPVFYRSWPKGELHVFLAMTQEGSAKGFIDQLKREGWLEKKETRASMVFFRNIAQKKVTLQIRVFPSNTGGWTTDSKGLNEALADAMKNPALQIVVYRGHAGDYDYGALGRVKTRDKVFSDLGCYSDYRSEEAIHHCKNCAYFGTLVVAQGVRNDVFLRQVLEVLARRMPYPKMRRWFEKTLPHTYYKFTGSYSRAGMYEYILTDAGSR